MNKLLPFDTLKLSSKIQTLCLLFFLALLGSHYLDYHLYLFVVAGLFLVSWQYITNKNFILIFLFILSIYVTWSFLDPRILYESHFRIEVFSQGFLILLMYLLGHSIIQTTHYDKLWVADKSIFYILFIFIISYSFFVFWSYITIKQDSPLNTYGMFVSFPNPYQRAHVNGGRLISTILTYYLTLMSFLLPLILLYFTRLKKQGFYFIELFFLVSLAIFVLYITAMMGRRTTFVLFSLVLILLLFIRIVSYFKNGINVTKYILRGSLILIVTYSTFHFLNEQQNSGTIKAIIITDEMIIPIVEYPKTLQEKIDDIPIYKKLISKGISDHRFTWWSTALEVMIDYPFGGGNGIYLEKGMRLAHNTWIDIGKDFGIIPFALFIIISLLHIYYLVYVILSKDVDILLKYQLIIIAIGTFAIMMIEPVFTSDKTFFAYIFFYFGILSRIHLEVVDKES